MKIWISGISVDDQAKALDFYTNKLGFKVKNDIPMGEHRWLTVVDPNNENGTELSLEPNVHPAVPPYTEHLKKDGIPITSFAVDDLESEYQRLKALDVTFTQEPTDAGDYKIATLDDTCGNLVQLIQLS